MAMRFSVHVLFPTIALIFLVQLVSAGQLDILAVTGASTTPAKVYPGDIVTLNFNVSNTSGVGQIAQGLRVRAELNENYFEAERVEERFESLGAKGMKTVSLRFRVKEGALPGNYRVPVILEYDSGSTRIVQKEEVSFSLVACSQLRIEFISLSEAQPHIGSQLGITVTIRNSCTTAARNVGVELKSVSNSTIAPFIAPSGTTQKIGDILPAGSKDVTFSVMIGDKVDAKTYVFSVDANCDECSKSASSQFSFQVLGRPELVFSNIDYSVEVQGGNDKQIMQGSPFTLSVQLENIGLEKAKAVEAYIDFGSGIMGSTKSFLGNINPDDSGAAVFNLVASYDAKPGGHPGKITVRYVDELGAKQEFSQDYLLYVNPQPPTSPVVYIAMLVLVAVVLGILYFIIKFIFRQLAIMKAQSK